MSTIANVTQNEFEITAGVEQCGLGEKQRDETAFLSGVVGTLKEICGISVELGCRDRDELLRKLAELAESCRLKVKFMESNNAFMENVVRDLQQLNEQQRAEIAELTRTLGTQQSRGHSSSASVVCSSEADRDEVIAKQRKEIQFYKNFIKNLMSE